MHVVEPERERACLEGDRNPCRIALETGIDVEPPLARRIVERDVVEIPVEENVLTSPVKERAGLVNPRCLSPASCLPVPPAI